MTLKKTLLFVVVLLIAICFAACSAPKESTREDVKPAEADQDAVVGDDLGFALSIIYTRNRESSDTYQITDRRSIEAVATAIKNISVTGETDEYMTDSEDVITFVISSDEQYTYIFENGCLADGITRYTVTGFEELEQALEDAIGY